MTRRKTGGTREEIALIVRRMDRDLVIREEREDTRYPVLFFQEREGGGGGERETGTDYGWITNVLDGYNKGS